MVNETVGAHKKREEVTKMGRTAAQTLMEEGALRTRQEDLLEFIKGKFGSIPQDIENKIRLMQDADRLKMLIRNVVHEGMVD